MIELQKRPELLVDRLPALLGLLLRVRRLSPWLLSSPLSSRSELLELLELIGKRVRALFRLRVALLCPRRSFWGSDLRFGSSAGREAPPSGEGRLHRPRVGGAVPLGHRRPRSVHSPCFEGRVTPPTTLRLQSQGIYATDACHKLLSFRCDSMRCGHTRAPGLCFLAARPDSHD